MAITRAQQAKQLLANGGRIGLKGGADASQFNKPKSEQKTPNVSAGGASFNKPDNTPSGDDIRRNKKEFETAVGISNLEKLEKEGVPKSNFPGLAGMALNIFSPLRNKALEANIARYKRTTTGPYTLAGYKKYMEDMRERFTPDDSDDPFIPINQMSTNMDQAPEEEVLSPIQQAIRDRGDASAFLADGGMPKDAPVGGIMDLESGRQMYFLGKLVKKATRAVKKIVKSPIGKAALLYAGGTYLGGLKGITGAKKSMGFLEALRTPSNLGNLFNFGKEYIGDAIGGMEKKDLFKLGVGGALTLAPLLFQEDDQEDEYQKFLAQRNAGGQLPASIADIRNNYRQYMGTAFLADGGRPEPVAKKTMPLLDMDGKEMDFRAEGGFVPIGRMERADDVPARLSKNEFVFTADAVRNAGEGDIDKGAEVMYNMMKNLEAGGEVSEESQGLDGARKMFQTSQRLEEVL